MYFDSVQTPSVVDYAPRSTTDDLFGPLQVQLGQLVEDAPAARPLPRYRVERRGDEPELRALAAAAPLGQLVEDAPSWRQPARYRVQPRRAEPELQALPAAVAPVLGTPWESYSSRPYIEYAPRNETIDVLLPNEPQPFEYGSWLDSSSSLYAYATPAMIGQADAFPALPGGAPPPATFGDWLESRARPRRNAARRAATSPDEGSEFAALAPPAVPVGFTRAVTYTSPRARARARTRKG